MTDDASDYFTSRTYASPPGQDDQPRRSNDAADPWPEPDMSVLRLRRRPPPAVPLEVFGAAWGDWIAAASEAAACPPDYVAAPLLASASAPIGHARWAQATPGWSEPPQLWEGAVGDSGDGKTPAPIALCAMCCLKSSAACPPTIPNVCKSGARASRPRGQPKNVGEMTCGWRRKRAPQRLCRRPRQSGPNRNRRDYGRTM